MSYKTTGHLLATLLFVFFTLTTGTPKSQAASIETLVMPGLVSEGHAQLETNCDNCHTKFDRQSQRILCLDCHQEIADDQTSNAGFHGKHPVASNAECAACHAEHKGRDADIVGLVPEIFDHSFTDFPLNGKHTSTACASCHRRDTLFREASSYCVSCHEQDEPHKGNLGTDCSSCHSESGWVETKFDHDEATDYPLTGAHVEAQCSSCHANEIYEDTATDCASCHKLDDVHNGERGTQCDNCHSTKEWRNAKFDHQEETGFALQGQHAKLVCANCHLADMALETPPDTCIGCHSTNDPHLGRNGDDCANCHNQSTWATKFNHEKETDFALNGGHSSLDCTACHKGALTDPLPTQCAECHAKNDPHAGALDQCVNCHNEDQWDKNLLFHHDLTKFSLLGAHKVTTCEQCHNGLKFAENNSNKCVDCHQDDDVHETSMGSDCVACHTPVEWRRWNFDHNTQTDYTLTGNHEGLVCDSCHKVGRTKPPPTNCFSCHQQDDTHRGSFGTNCQRCHNTNSFSEAQMGRN